MFVYDKSDLGLGQITNDAQLKRSGADFGEFSNKTTPENADRILIEDSTDSFEKKYISINSILSLVGSTEFVEVPTSSSSIGTVGNMAADDSYLYICYAENSWRRIAITNF